jgi:3-polyprenyl-4-hydroxybenzoate decarboxylase
MFCLLKKFQKRRARNVRNKIILFSIISGFFSAITAIFFSSEENRKKVSKGVKIVGQKVKEASIKAKEEIEKDIEKISQLAKEESEKLSSKFKRLKKQEDQILDEDKM